MIHYISTLWVRIEEADADEAIPINLKKERKTQAYKETMNIDIDNISTF